MEIKISGKTRFENLLKQLFHLPYALVGYFITSYPTRAHGIIAIYFFQVKTVIRMARTLARMTCIAWFQTVKD